MQKTQESEPQILTQKINLKSQLTNKSQEFKKDKSTPVKDWQILNFLINLQSLRNSISKTLLNQEKEYRNLKPEDRKLESQASFLRQKRKTKARQVKFSFKLKPQLPNLYQQKNLAAYPYKIEEEVQLKIKKHQSQTDKMEIKQKNQTNKNFISSLQQNVAIFVKRLLSTEVMSVVKKSA